MNPVDHLLEAVKDAVKSISRHEDIVLPIFNPDRNEMTAIEWCAAIEDLSAELGWGSLEKAARAGKALRGAVRDWFERWNPRTGRTWENLKTDIITFFPAKKIMHIALETAVLYNSDLAGSFCGYARKKIRLLLNTGINFSETQLIELVCGGISDDNVRVKCLNTDFKSISEMMTFLQIVKPGKERILNKRKSINKPNACTCSPAVQSRHISQPSASNYNVDKDILKFDGTTQFAQIPSNIPKPMFM